jgi:hypothetical protein
LLSSDGQVKNKNNYNKNGLSFFRLQRRHSTSQEERLDVRMSQVWMSSTYRSRIYADRFEPFLAYVPKNKRTIRGVTFINFNWNSQPMWRLFHEGSPQEARRQMHWSRRHPRQPARRGPVFPEVRTWVFRFVLW